MRKLAVILVMVLCVPYVCGGRNMERRYERMVRKYDVSESVKEAEDLEEFWGQLWRSNWEYMRFYKAYNRRKPKPAARETFKKYAAPKGLTDNYRLTLRLMDDFNETLDEVMEDLGADYMEYKPRLHVVDDREFNAYSYPDGDIYIQSGVLNNPRMTYWGLVGICVHEYAHYLLQHALVGIYDSVRKERRAIAIAAVAAGLNTAAAAYSSASGNYVDWDSVNRANFAFFDAAFLITDHLIYKYSREQEIEADIIAFRFLEYIGVGGEYYIDALRLAPSAHYSSTSDHPSTAYRVALLTHMKTHPDSGRLPR